MSKKIIFLDFDGVLNTEHYQNLLCYKGEPCQDEYGTLFDPDAVEQLRRIVEATNADIVVSSSWKILGLKAMQTLWDVRRMPGKVIDITPSTTSDNWLLTADLDDMDPATWQGKGMEIASWLADHAKDDARYVIIDDEHVILDSQQQHFILTNSHDGITEELADRAIYILNS